MLNNVDSSLKTLSTSSTLKPKTYAPENSLVSSTKAIPYLLSLTLMHLIYVQGKLTLNVSVNYANHTILTFVTMN